MAAERQYASDSWCSAFAFASVDCISLLLLAEPPCAPQNLRVISTEKDSFVVGWDRPESDGGAPITGYSIDVQSPNSDYVNVGRVKPNKLLFEVTGLAAGQSYNARVWAENSAGLSESAVELDKPAETKPGYGEYCFF